SAQQQLQALLLAGGDGGGTAAHEREGGEGRVVAQHGVPRDEPAQGVAQQVHARGAPAAVAAVLPPQRRRLGQRVEGELALCVRRLVARALCLVLPPSVDGDGAVARVGQGPEQREEVLLAAGESRQQQRRAPTGLARVEDGELPALGGQ